MSQSRKTLFSLIPESPFRALAKLADSPACIAFSGTGSAVEVLPLYLERIQLSIQNVV